MVPFSAVVLGDVPWLLSSVAGCSSAVGDGHFPGTTANATSPAAPTEGISKVFFKGRKKKGELRLLFPLNIVQIFFALILSGRDTFEMCVLSCLLALVSLFPVSTTLFCFFETHTCLVCAGKLCSLVMDQIDGC